MSEDQITQAMVDNYKLVPYLAEKLERALVAIPMKDGFTHEGCMRAAAKHIRMACQGKYETVPTTRVLEAITEMRNHLQIITESKKLTFECFYDATAWAAAIGLFDLCMTGVIIDKIEHPETRQAAVSAAACTMSDNMHQVLFAIALVDLAQADPELWRFTPDLISCVHPDLRTLRTSIEVLREENHEILARALQHEIRAAVEAAQPEAP